MPAEKARDFETLYDQALAYASVKHSGQTDHAGRAYIEHPKTVSAFCTSPLAKICALLHDTIEDTDATEEEIREKFGDRIAEVVMLLTHGPGNDVPQYMDYVHRLGSDPIAREVKLADLKHNMDLTRNYPILDSDVNRVVKKYVPAFNYLKGLEIEDKEKNQNEQKR